MLGAAVAIDTLLEEHLPSLRAFLRLRQREAGREVALEGLPPETSVDRRVADVVRAVASPSQEAAALETQERIERAFERIGEDEREIITLARIVGLSHAEIAARLGTEGAARVRLFRALARLSKELSADETPGRDAPG